MSRYGSVGDVHGSTYGGSASGSPFGTLTRTQARAHTQAQQSSHSHGQTHTVPRTSRSRSMRPDTARTLSPYGDEADYTAMYGLYDPLSRQRHAKRQALVRQHEQLLARRQALLRAELDGRFGTMSRQKNAGVDVYAPMEQLNDGLQSLLQDMRRLQNEVAFKRTGRDHESFASNPSPQAQHFAAVNTLYPYYRKQHMASADNLPQYAPIHQYASMRSLGRPISDLNFEELLAQKEREVEEAHIRERELIALLERERERSRSQIATAHIWTSTTTTTSTIATTTPAAVVPHTAIIKTIIQGVQRPAT
eukprot:Opistho-2@71493